MSETGDLISRIYANFRGADFRGEEINLTRSPECLNVWRDYREIESIRTRPGLELNSSFGSKIYGIFFYKDMLIVHSGTKLYKVVNGVKTELYSGAKAAVSDGFVYGNIYDNIWYFKDGKNYLRYDGTTISEVVGYIPTTSIARKANGGGTIYEDVNMLSEYRINTFLGDGESKRFYLDAPAINGIVSVEVNGEPLGPADYTWTTTSKETFVEIEVDPKQTTPKTDGQDNIVITFKKTVAGYKDKILGCTLLQVFDNRVFVSGNPDYPNTVWHCSLNDPTYFSDLDYYHEGLDRAAVKGIVAGNNALWVFREPSEANTTVFYHTPTVDNEYGKIYPSQHSSITTGCIGRAVNFNDDIIFFSERGMEGISGDVTTEQAVAHRSSLVDRKLIAEGNYKNMVLAEWEGYLLVFVGKSVYLADSRTVFTYEDHIEYEWFYWELDKDVISARVHEGILYIGASDGNVYTLTDNSANVESYWTTPKDKFKSPHKLKTTNKRGCVVEAEGDISVYAKVEDAEFELIGEHNGVKDYFVSRIKRKKFKDIQLKFHSNTRFSLETATLECFIGGYIKR